MGLLFISVHGTEPCDEHKVMNHVMFRMERNEPHVIIPSIAVLMMKSKAHPMSKILLPVLLLLFTHKDSVQSLWVGTVHFYSLPDVNNMFEFYFFSMNTEAVCKIICDEMFCDNEYKEFGSIYKNHTSSKIIFVTRLLTLLAFDTRNQLNSVG